MGTQTQGNPTLPFFYTFLSKFKQEFSRFNCSQGYETVLVRLDSSNGENLKYDPGDHLAIFPQNVKKTIRQFEKRLKNCPDSKSVVQLQIYGPNQSWESFRKIPPCSFKTLQTRFLDLTSPPNQSTLQLLASLATDNKEKTQLQFLAEVNKVEADAD